ncbi:MAG: hypothetical protein REI78_09900 [Pedobacter sp.]|nr:hypothetical protein [Pedobacter sp.]MDQ8053328.1 hypothetical protein [Pedobacter sp.]
MFLTYIVPLSILLPILLACYHYKAANTGEKLLFFYLVISGLINLTALILIFNHKKNMPLLHLYTIVEAAFLLSYFRTLFVQPLIKKILTAIIIAFTILCILNFAFLQGAFAFNTYTRPLEAIMVTFFCMLYLYKSGFTDNWLKKPTNWFNMGILIYFPVVCIIFILSNYLTFVVMNKAMNHVVWNLHGVFVLIMYLMWARGFSLIKNDR